MVFSVSRVACSCAVFRSLLGPQSAYRHRFWPVLHSRPKFSKNFSDFLEISGWVYTMGPKLLAHSIRSGFGAKNRQISGWEQSALSDCAKMQICQMTAQIAAHHSGASFGRYIALNVMICGSAGRSRPRLLGVEGPRPFGDAGPAFACRHCSNPCLSWVLFLFFANGVHGGNPLGQPPWSQWKQKFFVF